MRRTSFLRGTGGAFAAGALPSAVVAAPVFSRLMTQASLVDTLPAPVAGQWVRLILGSGVDYQKQVGAAEETTEHGRLLYYETQVGTPGGSCNPNTLKRTYLHGERFGSLLVPATVLAEVSTSGTLLTRWSDIGGGQTQTPADKNLRLLDATYLYDDRPLTIVSSTSALLRLPKSQVYGGSGETGRGALTAHKTTHTVARFTGGHAAEKLTAIELWTTPDVPFGIAKYRATVADMEPFELHVFSYGTHFKSDLAMSLKTIRMLTPDGTYVQTG